MKFEELNLKENLLRGITDAGFTTLMPVQEETLVHTLKGKDACVQSQTGTGKTAAFMVTIFQLFLDEDSPIKKKKALIIAPTRELAAQIEEDALTIGRYLDFTIGCFYGGIGYEKQERLLEKGVDIIIGTPGRLLDFHSKRKLDFDAVGILVIDEADRLFDMGFLPDIRRIVDSMSRRSKRQTMLFSATMDERTRAMAREYMKSPVRVEIQAERITVDTVTQELYHVAEREKMNLMIGVLKKEQPRNVLVFTNMKHTASKVAKQLEHNGFKAQYISGDLPQVKRLKVINSFKDGTLPIMVATDVAARGLHIEDLGLIVNYDLPQDCENYVHRIGRTARAGKSGKAISLVCENYVYNLEAIENYIGMKIPVASTEDNLFHENKAEGMYIERPRPTKGASRTREKKQERKGMKKTTPKPEYKKFDREAKYKKNTRSKSVDAPVSNDNIKEEKPVEKTSGPSYNARHVKKARPVQKTYAEKAPAEKKQPGKDKKQDFKKQSQVKPGGAKRKSKTLEDRLEYYQKKYGDNFSVNSVNVEEGNGQAGSPASSKPSLLKKILGIFRKKN
jgi:ATP-dependent RNA helicase RhlB